MSQLRIKLIAYFYLKNKNILSIEKYPGLKLLKELGYD